MLRDEIRLSRGEIADKFVAIEQVIVSLISCNYFNKVDADFALNIFGDDQSNFGFKRNAFLHLFKIEDKNFITNLNRLNKIRNTFCHAPLTRSDPFSQDYFFRETDDNSPVNINVNPKELLDEFNHVLPMVVNELNSVAKNKGWNFQFDI